MCRPITFSRKTRQKDQLGDLIEDVITVSLEKYLLKSLGECKPGTAIS
jgi:hypothetical protein